MISLLRTSMGRQGTEAHFSEISVPWVWSPWESRLFAKATLAVGAVLGGGLVISPFQVLLVFPKYQDAYNIVTHPIILLILFL